MKKKLFGLIMAVAMLFVSALPAGAATPSSEKVISPVSLPENYQLNVGVDVTETYLFNVGAANIAYFKLLNSFRKNEIVDDKYAVNGIHHDDYPEYYAGAFINTDGNLVISLVESLTAEEMNRARLDVIARAGTDRILFKTGKNAYKSLVDAVIEIREYYESGTAKDSKLTLQDWGIDEYNNLVVATVSGKNERSTESVTMLLEDARTNADSPVFGNDKIVFRVGKTQQEADVTINCGSGVYYTASNANVNFSGAFRASYTDSSGNEVRGFVTCGHAFIGINSAVTVRCSETDGFIGTLDTTRNILGGTIDAAFVKMPSTPPNTPEMLNKVVTANGAIYNIRTDMIMSPAQGSIVYMYGAKTDETTGNVRVGEVQLTSWDIQLKDEYNNSTPLFDQLKVSYQGLHGDSGGIVFMHATNSTYAAVGVHSGTGESSNVTKALNILNAFDVWIY